LGEKRKGNVSHHIKGGKVLDGRGDKALKEDG